MSFERSRSTTNNQMMRSGPKFNLLEHTVFRRQQLEKIMFAYHNLYRLHPSYTKMISEAFRTKNSLLLWNFENDCLLNSRELEDLMKQDCRQYSNSQSNYSNKNNNRNSLVNSLDARHKPLPLPSIGPKRKGKFLTRTGPPPDLLEMASSHPDATHIELNHQSLPSLMDMTVPSQPYCSRQESSNRNYSGSSKVVLYDVPPPPHNQVYPQQMMQTANNPPLVNMQRQEPYYFQPPANPENMVFPNSGQIVYGPPPPPLQVYQTPPPQMVPGSMPVQQPQYYPLPPPPNQIPVNAAYFNPPPVPTMMPSQPTYQQAPLPAPHSQMGQMMPPQPILQQHPLPMVPQMRQMYPSVPDQTYQQPSCDPYFMQYGPPPSDMNSSVVAGCMVPCVPVSAEPVNCQPPIQFIDPNHPDIVYDTEGCAYQRMVVNTTCLVPIQQYTETAVPAEQITSDQTAIKEVPDQGNVKDVVTENVDKPDDSDTGIEDCDSQTPVEPGNDEEESIDIVDKEENVSTLVYGGGEDIDDDLVSTSAESGSLNETFTSRAEMGEDSEQSERMDTPLAEVMNKCDISGSELQEVESNHYFDSPNEANNCCTIVLPSKQKGVEVQKTIVIEEAVDNEDAVHTASAMPLSGRKQKLTKKQKRIQAAEKAKELETDDAILEEALKAKKEYLAANRLTEAVDTPTASQKVPDNKKKSRDQMKVIIEKVTLSSPAPQLINPQIMHRIKTAIHARAKSLEETGRPTTNSNIYRQNFFQAVINFEKNFDMRTDESQTIKDFIEKRIAFFRTLSPALSFSRITIYEHLYVDIPKPLLIEIHFLMSLPTNTVEQIVQLEEFEDIFLSLF